jgi:adenylate kinase family enzyme/RimJ/RimL family protein N-acetyltransferase
LLVRHWPIVALSTGKMLREEIAAGTPIGLQVRDVLARGELVDDELMVATVRTWLTALPHNKGFLLDGFPRTHAQAQALDALLDEFGRPLTAVINLELTVSEAVYRLGGRRICYGVEPEEIIHINDEVAVSRCLRHGGLLVQRPDDLPNVIVRRLAVHEADTEPLMAFYSSRGIGHQISAAGSPAEVAQRIVMAINQAQVTKQSDRSKSLPLGHGSLTMPTRRGRTVKIRHVEPEDAVLLVDLFNRLSPTSRRMRFFVAKPSLPEGVVPPGVERLAQTDRYEQTALLATTLEDEQERAVGLAQLVFHPEDPEIGQVALVLRDDYQGEGLGRAMFDLLLQVALVRGLKRIIAVTLAENITMIELARNAGFDVTRETSDGETTLTLNLSGG